MFRKLSLWNSFRKERKKVACYVGYWQGDVTNGMHLSGKGRWLYNFKSSWRVVYEFFAYYVVVVQGWAILLENHLQVNNNRFLFSSVKLHKKA